VRLDLIKCDGCGTKLCEAEDAPRERMFTLRTPLRERDLDLCRECWQKMCAAIGINPNLRDQDGRP